MNTIKFGIEKLTGSFLYGDGSSQETTLLILHHNQIK